MDRWHSPFTSLVLLCGLAAPGMAEELETTTVTATRTEQMTRGSSVSAITDIKDLQATHPSEILSRSAGTWISRGNGQESLIAIRSPVFTGAGACSEFLVEEDNLPVRPPAFCNVNQLFETNFEQAERIEVLRGPGTVVHGAGAVHGVINVISPGFPAADEEPFGEVDLNYGTHGYSQLAVDYRDPAWMLQGNVIHDAGYKHDAGFNQQKLRVKGQQQVGAWNISHSANITNLEQETATYVVGKDAYKDPDRKRENPNPDAYRNAWSFRYFTTIDYQPDDEKQLILKPYLRSSGMDSLMHFVPGTPVEENSQTGGGIQAIYFRPYRDDVDILSGFDLDITAGALKQYQAQSAGPTFPAGTHYNYKTTVYTAAWFAQADIRASENWLLTVGARLENSWYIYQNRVAAGSACDPSVTNCRYFRPASDDLEFFNWSPEFTAQYQMVPDHYTYLRLIRGYRPPHTSELFRLEQGQNIANIRSVIANSIEWGLRGDVNDIFAYHATFYYMKKNNVIVKTADRQQIDGQRTQHQGVELTMNLNLLDVFLIDVAAAYGEHRYDSNVQVFNATSSQIKGNWIDTAPHLQGSMQFTWLATDSAWLQLDVNHIGPYFLDAENRFRYDGHTLFNLRYQQLLPDNWTLRLALINATNEDFADRADVTVATPLNPVLEERYFIGEPRNLRVGISKAF